MTELVTVERRTGSFDRLCSEISYVTYFFRGLPWGSEEFGLLEGADFEFKSGAIALSMAVRLHDSLKCYGTQSCLNRLDKIIEYLANNREEQEVLFAERKVRLLTDRILALDKKLAKLKKKRNDFETWLDGRS